MKTKSGTNLVKKFREQAQRDGQSMFIGTIWNDYGTSSMGIWLYGAGETTKVRPPVAKAPNLDALYGRT